MTPRTALTADAITDEQIRDLRDREGLSASLSSERIRWMCGCALGEPGYSEIAKSDCRARCAVLLNARKETP